MGRILAFPCSSHCLGREGARQGFISEDSYSSHCLGQEGVRIYKQGSLPFLALPTVWDGKGQVKACRGFISRDPCLSLLFPLLGTGRQEFIRKDPCISLPFLLFGKERQGFFYLKLHA